MIEHFTEKDYRDWAASEQFLSKSIDDLAETMIRIYSKYKERPDLPMSANAVLYLDLLWNRYFELYEEAEL